MDSRAEFRDWAEAHYVSPAFKISGSDDYADEIIQGAWEGWQASRQAIKGEAVGIAQPYAPSPGMTQCVFTAKAVPVGAKLYTHPASRQEFDVQKECWRHEAEDLQALHQNLDNAGVPRYENDVELSSWGRALRMNQDSVSAVVPKGEVVAYQYWWPESPRQVTVCKAKNLPSGGPDLIVVPLYTHLASAQKEIERWKVVAHDQAETISELQSLIHANHHEQASQNNFRESPPLPFWEPCNPGCDPEFNGQRSLHCADHCAGARDAIRKQEPSQ